MDQAIHEFIAHQKIPSKNFFLAGVASRQDKNQVWDFSELGITLEKQDALERMAIDFERLLNRFQRDMQFKKEIITRQRIVYHVYIQGFYTHKFQLVVEEPEKADLRKLPKIAIIIDDIGYDPSIMTDLKQADFPLTLSVLTGAPYQDEFVDLAKKKNWELMVHMPMEPKKNAEYNSVPDMLLLKMNEEEISTIVNKDLEELPEAKGVNNHMGSAFTEHEDRIMVVLNVIKKKNLFFIDSRTTSQTVAFQIAKKIGVPAASRSVFLDNDLSSDAITLQMERLIGIAEHSGQAIGIGHPHPETIKALKRHLPSLTHQINVVMVSEIVHSFY